MLLIAWHCASRGEVFRFQGIDWTLKINRRPCILISNQTSERWYIFLLILSEISKRKKHWRRESRPLKLCYSRYHSLTIWLFGHLFHIRCKRWMKIIELISTDAQKKLQSWYSLFIHNLNLNTYYQDLSYVNRLLFTFSLFLHQLKKT